MWEEESVKERGEGSYLINDGVEYCTLNALFHTHECLKSLS